MQHAVVARIEILEPGVRLGGEVLVAEGAGLLDATTVVAGVVAVLAGVLGAGPRWAGGVAGWCDAGPVLGLGESRDGVSDVCGAIRSQLLGWHLLARLAGEECGMRSRAQHTKAAITATTPSPMGRR